MVRAARGTAALGVLLGLGCGGSPSSHTGMPGPSGGPVTATFMGTARSGGPNSCGGDALPIDAGSGEVSVTLVQAAPATPLLVQMCAPSATNHERDCSINRSLIAVGETKRGVITGGRAQVLALNPGDCGNSQPPQFPSIAYTVSVVYPR